MQCCFSLLLCYPLVPLDQQVKRIHEYKRQLLNIMGVIYRYQQMKKMTAKQRAAKYVPRVVMFGGKAFATYWQAKRIVKLITDVAATINNDPEIGDLLKVIMVPDYNVSVAEVLIPASELSQHIRYFTQPKYVPRRLHLDWMT
jgi:starch phosphorylase